MTIKSGIAELDEKFHEIDLSSLNESRKQLEQDNEKTKNDLMLIEERYFSLNKDLLVLAGTIFGSSIALSTGRNVNLLFIFGEMFLCFSILFGLLKQLNQLSSQEWLHALQSKMSIERFLLLQKDKAEKFELEIMSDLVMGYQKIIDSTNKGLIHYLIKVFPVERLQFLFISSLVLGILTILFSIVPIDKITVKLLPIQDILLPSSTVPVPTDIFYVPLN